MSEDRHLDRVMRRTATLGLVAVAVSVYWRSWSISLGVLAGVALAMLNFWALRRLVSSLIARGKMSAGAGFVIKLGVVFGALFVLIKVLGLDAIGLMAGFSVLVVAITTSGQGIEGASSPDDTQEGGEPA